MFIRNMFLDERGSFEKLLTRFTPKFTLIFLLEIWPNSFAQLPEKRTM
jgi:3-deoxy-D-manno-octulosonic-acid transferase